MTTATSLILATRSLGPVSYTHLDVYKRQTLYDLTIEPIRVMHGKQPILGYRIGSFGFLTDLKSIVPEELEKLRGVEPVSYTHLDVYKRQVYTGSTGKHSVAPQPHDCDISYCLETAS